jgi:predicted nuclease of restriction endonuclease-like (RecB) superfamily
MSKKKELIGFESYDLLPGVSGIIDQARQKVSVYLNTETTLMYWTIGAYINKNLKENNQTEYGAKILATLSQQLTEKYGKGYSYSAITRMCKIALTYNKKNIATLSQQLSWSHLIELSTIADALKREYYTIMCYQNKWGVRDLREHQDKMSYERTAIARLPEKEIKKQLIALKKSDNIDPDLVFKSSYVLDFLNLPHAYNESELENALVGRMEQFILELGSGFAFIERQKRISVDGEDYHLDLLFFHRKLKRLVAIDLKLGKFKPSYKGQMELYLRWLEKYEMHTGEEKPIGLLLCSEGNNEHVELLMLQEKDIKVAQYLTELPNKKWFAERLHRAIELTRNNNNLKELI